MTSNFATRVIPRRQGGERFGEERTEKMRMDDEIIRTAVFTRGWRALLSKSIFKIRTRNSDRVARDFDRSAADQTYQKQ
jgi:hypothetical protein